MNIELLEKAARKFVEIWPEEKFDMKGFNVDQDGNEVATIKSDTLKHFCTTAACFAGSLPWLGIPELEPIDCDFVRNHGGLNYYAYTERLFFVSSSSWSWQFIFGSKWPNDKLEVLGRVIYFKSYGVPSDLDFEKTYKVYI